MSGKDNQSHLKDVLLEHIGQHTSELSEAIKIITHYLLREELMEILREAKRREDNESSK